MPPKIEEIDEIPKSNSIAPKPIKNPFASKPKKTTIRRDAKEVYPVKKGLNKIDYVGTSPLDILFQDLERILDGDLHEISLLDLKERLGDGITDVSISPESSNFTSEFISRYQVIDALLDMLSRIQALSNDSKMDDENLIKISLHDIKTFSKLINTVVIHGIYPSLINFHIGIPIAKRSLSDFGTKREIKIDKLPLDKSGKRSTNEVLIKMIYLKFLPILQVEGDVRELLIKGTGYSDFLTISIALITIPEFSFSQNDLNQNQISKEQLLDDFKNIIIKIPDTFELFQTYTLFLTTPSPPYFKVFVMNQLKCLPYDSPRKDGVLTLIEFVLGLREQEEINVDKFEHVANIILLKPKEISTMNYFKSIGDQMYDLLININKPTVTSCVGFILERLWEKNRMVAQDFVLKQIWRKLNPDDLQETDVKLETPSEGILVSEAELNNNINVLISLSKKGLTPSLFKHLMEPIILPLWAYMNFLKKNGKSTEIVNEILISYFTILKDSKEDTTTIFGLDTIAKNLLWDGKEGWVFEIGLNKLVQIVKRTTTMAAEDKTVKVNNFVENLDSSCLTFIQFLKDLEDEYVQRLFISILKRWLTQKTLLDEDNPFIKLMDLRLLESICNEFKDELAKTPIKTLEIVEKFLEINFTGNVVASSDSTSEDSHHDTVDSDDEDDFDESFSSQTLPIVLELLSAILSESSIELDEDCFKTLKVIQKYLKGLSNQSQKISSASQSLYSRIDDLLCGSKPVTTEREAQTKLLSRAITSLNDPLVPIRAHGLYLLRQLVDMRSDVISLDFVINLHLIQLKDPEPFIYLNVIKGLESLVSLNEVEVLGILTKLYRSDDSECDLDDKLKIGEVLLRYIQHQNQIFSGNCAKLVVETALSVIRLENVTTRAATNIGPKETTPTSEVKLDSDSSKKENHRDNRIRMSSMSLLGVCCKVNPVGIIDNLENAIDCALMILQLEKDKESSIMRRAAVVLIHDLILGTSNSPSVPFPQNYQSKVVTVLKYVKETDVDILVREQCQVVLDTIDELVELAVEYSQEDVGIYSSMKI